MSGVPAHAPPRHESFAVQAFPSSQASPSALPAHASTPFWNTWEWQI